MFRVYLSVDIVQDCGMKYNGLATKSDDLLENAVKVLSWLCDKKVLRGNELKQEQQKKPEGATVGEGSQEE